jgi:hypothetical protein
MRDLASETCWGRSPCRSRFEPTGVGATNPSGPRTFSALPLGSNGNPLWPRSVRPPPKSRYSLLPSARYAKLARQGASKNRVESTFEHFESLETSATTVSRLLPPAFHSLISCKRLERFVYVRWQGALSTNACTSGQGAHGPCYGNQIAFDTFSGFWV